MDTCGTGGDASGTFNISTAAAFVAAGAGVRIAKHGNRSISSKCGSADVLEALGVSLDVPPERVGAAIREIGIGFLFAPALHTAMRHAMPARRRLGRTAFNLLGPLTNPAGARAQVAGVFSDKVVEKVALVLSELDVERAFVVHGAGGLDEISLSGETTVGDVRHTAVRNLFKSRPKISASIARRSRPSPAAMPRHNAALIRAILAGEKGPRTRHRRCQRLRRNRCRRPRRRFPRRRADSRLQSIDSGAALKKLNALIEFSARS